MKLFFRDSGGGGPSIVILHGLFGSWTNWQSVSKALEGDFRVITPDLRNHGKSPHSPDAGYRAMVSDIRELREDLGLGPFIIAGHSMGGKVAMLYALEHPGEIERLAVFDMAPKRYPPYHEEILAGLSDLANEPVSSRSEADGRLAAYVPDSGTRTFLLTNLVRSGAGFSLRIGLEPLRQGYDEITGWPYAGNGKFEKPALFLRGGDSQYVLDSDLPEIRRLFPGAVLKTVPGATHWLHAEKPDDFLSLFTAFLPHR